MKANKATLTVKIEVLSTDCIPGLLSDVAAQISAEYHNGSLTADDGDHVEWKLNGTAQGIMERRHGRSQHMPDKEAVEVGIGDEYVSLVLNKKTACEVVRRIIYEIQHRSEDDRFVVSFSGTTPRSPGDSDCFSE